MSTVATRAKVDSHLNKKQFFVTDLSMAASSYKMRLNPIRLLTYARNQSVNKNQFLPETTEIRGWDRTNARI